MKNKIEQGIPLPSSTRARKYPFLDMMIEESIFYPDEKVNGRAYKAAMATGHRHNLKFVARPEGEALRTAKKISTRAL